MFIKYKSENAPILRFEYNLLGLNLCPLISRVPGSIRESRMLDDSEDNPGIG